MGSSVDKRVQEQQTQKQHLQQPHRSAPSMVRSSSMSSPPAADGTQQPWVRKEARLLEASRMPRTLRGQRSAERRRGCRRW